MDTQFVTVDPPASAPPGSRERHVALVGVAGSNTDLLADALDPECSVDAHGAVEVLEKPTRRAELRAAVRRLSRD